MRRRDFITALGAAAMWPLAARAQASLKGPTIAWMGTSQQLNASFIDNFLRGMRELGYAEGRNFQMLYQFTDGYQERVPALTEEVIRSKPDVILAASVIYAVAARKASSTIPIVSPALADAVHLGLIASEARPGGNVTGIQPYVAGLPAKQIEFAREIVRSASKVGLLTNSKDPKAPAQALELEALARAANIKIVSADANRPDDLGGALRILSDERVDVVIVLQTSMLLAYGRQIAVSALEKRLPTVYGYREHVVAGGLISYGVDLRWCYYRGGPNSARDRPRGFADRVSDEDVFGGQSKNGERVGHRGVADAPRPRRRGDRIATIIAAVVIDGEAVLLGVDAISDFNGLHGRKHDREVEFYAFDMLVSDGEDVRKPPLSMRKTNLSRRWPAVSTAFMSRRSSKAKSVRTCFVTPA